MNIDVNVSHCNSIDAATSSISPGSLNIKYGPNGTGKTTLAKAIELTVRGENLAAMLPFNTEGKPHQRPSRRSKGLQGIKPVFIFNEDYINQFVFQQDEVVKNSFDIFIKNAEYDTKMAAIEAAVAGIKDTFKKNAQLDQVLRDLVRLADLSESFDKSQSGFSKAVRLSKALGGGNKLEHIPAILTPYTAFIRSEASAKWIGWQLKGSS